MKTLLAIIAATLLCSCSTPPTPAQQQAIANAVATAGQIGGSIVIAMPNKNLTPAEQKAIADGLATAATAGAQVIAAGPTSQVVKPAAIKKP